MTFILSGTPAQTAMQPLPDSPVATNHVHAKVVKPKLVNSTEQEHETQVEKRYTDQDVEALAKMVYGEALITHSDMEMSAVVWCVVNRFISGDPYYSKCHSLYDIVVQKSQFFGYSTNNPVDEHIEWLVIDVLDRWSREMDGETDVGRTLPQDYLFFHGNGRHNLFTKTYGSANHWDWSYENPYDN